MSRRAVSMFIFIIESLLPGTISRMYKRCSVSIIWIKNESMNWLTTITFLQWRGSQNFSLECWQNFGLSLSKHITNITTSVYEWLSPCRECLECCLPEPRSVSGTVPLKRLGHVTEMLYPVLKQTRRGYLFQGQCLNLDLSDIKVQAVSMPNELWLR